MSKLIKNHELKITTNCYQWSDVQPDQHRHPTTSKAIDHQSPSEQIPALSKEALEALAVKVRQKAHQQGYDAGYQQAIKEVQTKLQRDHAHLHTFMATLQTIQTQLRQDCAQQASLLTLQALQALLPSITHQLDTIKATIELLLEKLPETQSAILLLSPEDHAKLKQADQYYQHLIQLPNLTISSSTQVKSGAILRLEAGEYDAQMDRLVEQLKADLCHYVQSALITE